MHGEIAQVSGYNRNDFTPVAPTSQDMIFVGHMLGGFQRLSTSTGRTTMEKPFGRRVEWFLRLLFIGCGVFVLVIVSIIIGKNSYNWIFLNRIIAAEASRMATQKWTVIDNLSSKSDMLIEIAPTNKISDHASHYRLLVLPEQRKDFEAWKIGDQITFEYRRRLLIPPPRQLLYFLNPVCVKK